MQARVNRLIILTVTWLLRILCGGLFVFSGFVKAIDPWGTIFKVIEYLGAFGFDVPFPLIRLGVFALCAFEFVVGCFLILGCFRKSCPWVALLIMFFMLPLSLWLAISDPVSDCGCFGDALHISNWATFFKNTILTGGLIWLIFNNLKCVCLISPAFQWLAVVSSGVFILIIELIGFFYQPLLDFRGFPIGEYLFSNKQEEDNINYHFIYEKNGEKRRFTIDSIPDDTSGWHFVDREILITDQNKKNEEKEYLHVFDVSTSEDLTEDVAGKEQNQLIVMIPKVSAVSPATTWKLNAIYEWCENNDVEMLGVVSGSPEEIENWEDLSMASYPIYMADDTIIKEIVRGNPGIVYLEKGKILWKSSLSAIDIDDSHNEFNDASMAEFGKWSEDTLLRCVLGYLVFIVFLILISFTPRLTRLLVKGGLASKKGVRHH